MMGLFNLIVEQPHFYKNAYNKWDFEGEYNAEITLLDSLFC